MKVECTRFRVQKGKTDAVNEWMQFLNNHMEEVLLTLNGEKMYVETIFREQQGEEEYLYWYSVQGEGAHDVEDSDHWIDKKHLEFWNMCIDTSYPPVDLTTEVVMIPHNVKSAMQ